MGRIKAGKSNGKLKMRTALILLAVIPMLVSVVSLSLIFSISISRQLESSTQHAMQSLVEKTGESFDYAVKRNEEMLYSYAQAPVIKEALLHPDNQKLAAKAQKYTENFYGQLEGWEGIYTADWNTKVLMHNNSQVVGKVMREGDARTQLQDTLKDRKDVYNVGIIKSPASGKTIISMYATVFGDDGQPIGYVGGGSFADIMAKQLVNVSALDLKSAYIYFSDLEANMLYNPDESKIGSPVQNKPIRNIVADLNNGKKYTSGFVKYTREGISKYAAYAVGESGQYVAVLTANEEDVMANVYTLVKTTVIISIAFIVAFVVLTLFVATKMAKPLTGVAKTLKDLSTGDVTVACEEKSQIREIVSVLTAIEVLRDALNGSMTNVNTSAKELNHAIESVDVMTSQNAESIGQINMAIDDVAKTSQSVAESAQIMAEKAIALGENVDHLEENVTELFAASNSIKEANEEATDCMKSVYDGANQSVASVKNISDKIAETNEAIEGIGDAIQAIEAIASQTNLLSLNASIEAARAGELGKGFAVVANEIRDLADSSAESAKEIKEIIENVMNLSHETVEISNSVSEVIAQEQSDIVTTQEKFVVLSDSVEASISRINAIKDMAVELGNIKEIITNSTTDLGAISEELGASAEEVAASCQTVSDACEDTQESAVKMRQANENVTDAIDFFKLS
jgi:methyl-accepting chemotaxis protein